MDDSKPAPDAPAFVNAAEYLGIGRDQGVADPRLTQAPGLRDVPNSTVPYAEHSHVMGPGQAAVDPVAAGLDMGARPISYSENRAVTTADGQLQKAVTDAEAEASPGPTGGATGAPAVPEQDAAELPRPGPIEQGQQPAPDAA